MEENNIKYQVSVSYIKFNFDDGDEALAFANNAMMHVDNDEKNSVSITLKVPKPEETSDEETSDGE